MPWMSGPSYGTFVERNNMPNYDVVTVSFENVATIQRYLEPWVHANRLSHLTVVDNASKDGTVPQLQAVLLPQQIQLNTDNIGYAKAANQGAAVGRQPYIAFINPDCFVQSDTVCKLVEFLHENPQIGIVGCRVLNENGGLQAASCRRLPTFWRVFNHVTGLYHLGLPGINKSEQKSHQSGSVEAINGALFVIRRDLFEQLNGFDEAFPLHFEDLDLFARCLKSRHEIFYLADYQATHLQGASTQDNKRVKRWKKHGLKRYFLKHRPRWEQWFVNRLTS